MTELTVAQQIAFFAAHPPSSLAEVRCSAAVLEDYPFDGHGEPVNAVFAISCRCEGIEFIVEAHDGDDGLEPPVKLTCTECGAASVVFDPRRHGHDGALGHNARSAGPRGPLVPVYGRGVEGPYEVWIRFEYPADTLGEGTSPGWKGRESELYSWITVVGLGADTDTLATLFDYECA